MDKFQERYLAHQAKKKSTLSGKYEDEIKYSYDQIDALKTIFENRNSSRVFSGEPVTDSELEYVLNLVSTSPSSCDRKGVEYKIITDREDKETLSGLLVGGVGWIYRADKIVLLLANSEAYKSPAEKEFMPYLDAGVMIQSFYLACEALGLKCCYVNPNIRESNKIFFQERFGEFNIYCGAIAIGK